MKIKKIKFYLSRSLVFLFLIHQAVADETRPLDKLPPDSIYQLSSVWQSTDGQSFKLEKLRGSPQLVAMFYASCHSACPVVIDEMKKIVERLSPEERKKVGELLFTFDPSSDTAESLKAYADKRKLDLTQWKILRGGDQDILELAVALGVKYKRNSDGGYSHSNVVLLLDRDGRIAARFEGLQTDPQKAAEEIRQLLKKAAE